MQRSPVTPTRYGRSMATPRKGPGWEYWSSRRALSSKLPSRRTKVLTHHLERRWATADIRLELQDVVSTLT